MAAAHLYTLPVIVDHVAVAHAQPLRVGACGCTHDSRYHARCHHFPRRLHGGLTSTDTGLPLKRRMQACIPRMSLHAPYWKFHAVVIPMETHFHPARSWESGRPAVHTSINEIICSERPCNPLLWLNARSSRSVHTAF